MNVGKRGSPHPPGEPRPLQGTERLRLRGQAVEGHRERPPIPVGPILEPQGKRAEVVGMDNVRPEILKERL